MCDQLRAIRATSLRVGAVPQSGRSGHGRKGRPPGARRVATDRGPRVATRPLCRRAGPVPAHFRRRVQPVLRRGRSGCRGRGHRRPATAAATTADHRPVPSPSPPSPATDPTSAAAAPTAAAAAATASDTAAVAPAAAAAVVHVRRPRVRLEPDVDEAADDQQPAVRDHGVAVVVRVQPVPVRRLRVFSQDRGLRFRVMIAARTKYVRTVVAFEIKFLIPGPLVSSRGLSRIRNIPPSPQMRLIMSYSFPVVRLFSTCLRTVCLSVRSNAPAPPTG